MSVVDYKEIFEKAEVGIALNDPEKGLVGKVNERYAEMTGYERAELQEMTIEEISAEDPTFDQGAAMEKIQRAIAGDSQQFDWLFQRKDGSHLWVEVALKRTTISGNDRLLAFVRDISKRKKYEQELEQQNQHLEEFANIISHDLRNPLNVAMGQLKMAQKDCDSGHLDEMERAHQRMGALIEDVLSLARAGESIGETQPVELSELVRRCWETVETKSSSLVTANDAIFRADETRLRQLLENLVRNAIEHGGEGVTVTVGGLDGGFFVEDDGPGIPEDSRKDIFEVGHSTSPEGTGFGLSIVKQVADAHGWEIHVTTGKDGGARFEFTGVQYG